MNLFYHITSRRNLESIQKEGLLPQYGYLSELVMEQRSAIYLFKELDEVRYAMENWFGECIRYVYAPKDLILLRINLPDEIHFEERFGWEAICYTRIPPECISVVPFPE
ncbi:MAG TPA: hypothetical protein IAC91_08010 [Candidatus Faecimorpha stercoravium]|jgi:hypothetical protein|nr:hypothetical protein [Candidatus Faecimorpha stercoravium]